MQNKMKTRDLIYAGAFGAIYLVATIILVTATGTIPVLYLVSPFIVGVVNATIYMVYVSKTKKRGAILILAILFGLVTGSTFLPAFFWSLFCGILAELIAASGKYQSKRSFLLSFPVFNLNMIGPFFMLAFAKDQFIALTEQFYGQAYADKLASLTSPWLIVAQAGLALLGGAIGAFIAAKLIHKHFAKAGLV